jgi:hypothetical protein
MDEISSSQLAVLPYCYPRSCQILPVAYYAHLRVVIICVTLRYFGGLTRNFNEYFVFIVFIGNNS